MTVTAGKYHLVKRMIAAAGNRVEALNRIAIGCFEMPLGLVLGQWMWLQAADLERLSSPGSTNQDDRC
jgi:16S rRNA pseudouridine516 synthase